MILDQIRSVKHGASTNLAVSGSGRVGKTSIIKNVMMEFEDDKEIISADMQRGRSLLLH